MARIGITLPVGNTPNSQAAPMAKWAEDAGFESAWDYELLSNPYVCLAAAAQATSRISLCTGPAVAFTTTPWATAVMAADIDELSGGRMILGLATGSPDFLVTLHGLQYSEPIGRLRDYVLALRVAWDALVTGQPPTYQGKFYQVYGLPLMEDWKRPALRDRLPIYLSAVRPRMLQTAGEVADGALGFMLSPHYLREVAPPNLAIGAERAGRDPGDVDLASFVICSPHPDREEARRRARIQVGIYAAHPLSDAMIQFHGLEKEQEVLRTALFSTGPQSLPEVCDEKLVDLFAISGTPDECRRQLSEFDGALPHVVLHTPYMLPLTSEESAETFRLILEAFGPA